MEFRVVLKKTIQENYLVVADNEEQAIAVAKDFGVQPVSVDEIDDDEVVEVEEIK